MSVTGARGFRAAGVTAGLKPSGRPDLAVVVNDGPRHDAAAVFTRNRIKAAPVLWSAQAVRDGRVDAVVLNSGGANACTGPLGFQDTHATAERAGELLEVAPGDVVVCSTGLIGQRLPMPALLSGLELAAGQLSAQGGQAAAEAILTTDTVTKQAVAHRHGFTVGGMAKGAGMLAPALATMLVVLTTDVVADPAVLDAALRRAVARTFERIDADGCMSTNDTVVLLASGASGVNADEHVLELALEEVCQSLALGLIADAEGASKQVQVEVLRAATEEDALDVARAVARNNLLKCALAGSDPNWGRVLAAVGTTRARFEPERLAVAMNDVWVCRDGAAGIDRSACDLSGRDVHIVIDLGAGDVSATVWTTDLTTDYVHENSAYST
ncbi:MAG: bifunctional glutamate N-acetyltransferase/amino-acid acetyltransferase ArgJ [Actinomycetales bacterium]